MEATVHFPLSTSGIMLKTLKNNRIYVRKITIQIPQIKISGFQGSISGSFSKI